MCRSTVLRKGSFSRMLYGDKDDVDERHRHRYEVNPNMIDVLESKGLFFSGKDVSGERMEIIELDRNGNICTYTHTHIHTHIHTYIHTYGRTYVHTYKQRYAHTYLFTY